MNKLRIIHVMIRVFKSLVFGGGLIAIIFIALFPEGQMVQMGEPFWLVQNPKLIKEMINLLPKEGATNYLDVQANMEVPLTTSLKGLISFFIIVVSIYIFYLLNLAHLVVKEIRLGRSFTQGNIKKLKVIGILIALSMFGEKILTGISDLWFSNTYKIEGLKLVSNTHLGWYIVIVGALIFALGAAFEQGLKLQEEQELTI